LDGDVSKQKLDLIQFTARKMTEPRAASPKIMRRKLVNSGSRRCGANDFPQHLGRHSCSPNSTCLVDRSKNHALGNLAGFLPFIDCNLHPRRDRNSTDVPSLAQEVSDNPMLLA
jgi:hypothetical protein